VSDVSGRGFKPNTSDFGQVRTRRNEEGRHNLDDGNRFFNDNKKIYETFNPQAAKTS